MLSPSVAMVRTALGNKERGNSSQRKEQYGAVGDNINRPSRLVAKVHW